MKLDKKYQIEKAASVDPTRYVLTNIYITEDKKNLVATNGQILAIVPVELDVKDDRGNGAIPLDVLTTARKKSKRFEENYVNLNGVFQFVDNSTIPRPEEPGIFPNYQQLIPQNPQIKNTVTLNPEGLLNLAKALGDSKSITLEFQDQSGTPVIAHNGKAYGLIMPLKTEKV